MKNEGKLDFLEKCDVLADLLIPGDPSAELINLSQLVRGRLVEDPELQILVEAFVIEVEEFLGHEIGAKQISIGQLDQFLKNTKGDARLFLLKILEIYYTDERVLKFYPNFSGNIFPNYRRLPTLKIEMLEHVLSDPGELEN
jgi:hypothetical protein